MSDTQINIQSEETAIEFTQEQVAIEFVQEEVQIEFVQETTQIDFVSENIVLNLTGVPGPPGVGVPVGGTAGQVLAKINGDDYNTEWVDQSGGGGGGASITEITYADMATALQDATLTPGQFYNITDAAGTDLGFICQAVKENEITVNGTGGYLNADFQAVGDYSGAESYVKYYIYYFDQTAPFTVGETITGDDNGSVAVVLSDDGVELLEISVSSGDWETETTFSGGTSGSTAIIDSYETDDLSVQIGIWRPSFEALTIAYTNLSGGTFAAGNTITGGTTGATAIIVTDDGAEMTAYMTSMGVAFDGSEVLDNGNGVTADMGGAATGATIILGNIVIWNLFHYQLTDDTNLDGNSPEENTAAYTLLDKATENVGYITAWDKSDFNLTSNEIIARPDVLKNTVIGDIEFPFGNANIYNNYAYSANVNCSNYPGVISGNTIFSGGMLSLSQSSSENSGVTDCLIYQLGNINAILGDDSYVDANVVQPDGQLGVAVGNNCRIKGNSVSAGAAVSEIITGNDCLIEDNLLENGGSLTGITAEANVSILRNKIGLGGYIGEDMVLAADTVLQENTLGPFCNMRRHTYSGAVEITRNFLISSSNINDISAGVNSSVSQNILTTGARIADLILGENCEIGANYINSEGEMSEITSADGLQIVGNTLGNVALLAGINCGADCRISGNNIESNGILGGSMVLGDAAEVNNNTILLGIEVSNKTFAPGVLFNGNTIGVPMTETETITDNIEGKRAIPGFSDIPGTIDITGLTTLDITAAWAQYRGIFNLTSDNATESIDTITNPPTLFPFTLRPAAGLVLTITGTAYAGIGAGQIALKATDYVLDGDKGEYIVLEIDPNGTGCLVEKLVVNGLI